MMTCKRAWHRFSAGLAAALLMAGAPALAHEGEDHSEPGTPVAVTTAFALGPSGEARSDRYEVVVQGGVDEPILTIYLDHYATNAPIGDARVSLVRGPSTLPARQLLPGTYEVRLPQALPHGTTDLDVMVQSPAGDDLLSVKVLVPEHEEAASGVALDWPSVTVGAGALALLALFGFFALRYLHRRPAVAGGLLVVATFLALTPQTLAHGDEPHGDEPAGPATRRDVVAGPLAGDRPARAADGSVMLPKPSQRLLGVRTFIGGEGTGASASRLQAQVIPDPARFARLATARGGRVLASGGAFPRPGQQVAAGQILFQLQPALSAFEASSSAAELRSLDREVALAVQELRRLQQLRGIVAGKDVERARTNLAGLRAQRSAAAGTVESVELVRAPISGTVSTISTAIGSVAEPGSSLAEMVGSGGWLIEARGLAPGQQIAGTTATGMTADGRRISLRLLGRSPQLIEGVDRFLFAIDNGAGSLRGGEAVTVEAVLVGSAVQRGVILPADAVTRGPSGETVVWVKPSALRFVPRQVRSLGLPGGRVLVSAGLQPGERVVTKAAGLLGQIR